MKKEYQSFGLAREFIRKLGLKSVREWNTYCKSGKKPTEIPSEPSAVYKGVGWIGWGDWLGTGRIANADKTFKSFEEARKFVRSLGLKNQKDWVRYYKSGNRPDDIPSNAHIVYKSSWRGFGDWLGTDVIAPQNRQYLYFEEARKYVQSLRLKGYEDWIEYCKSGNKPADIPSNPARTYEKEWKGWGDWLGYLFSPYETNYNKPKQKLTLSLSKKTVERAKSRNINISALTEILLNTLTYSPINPIEEKKVIEYYEALFDNICQLLKNYSVKVETGLQLHGVSENDSESVGSPILLDASGLILLTNHSPQKVSVPQVLTDLYNPKKILGNVIMAIIQGSEKNKHKVRELELALRLVNAMLDWNDGQA